MAVAKFAVNVSLRTSALSRPAVVVGGRPVLANHWPVYFGSLVSAAANFAAAAAPEPWTTTMACPQARLRGLSPEFFTGRATGRIFSAICLSGEALVTAPRPAIA